MRLEFEQQIVPDDLHQELDFTGYLSLFELEIPLLPRIVLRALSREEGEKHFGRLRDLENRLGQKGVKIEEIIARTRQLPRLDHLLPAFENRSLEQFHLHGLGHFVQQEQVVRKLEESFPVTPGSGVCNDIRSVLERYTQNGYSGLRYSPQEEWLRRQIEVLERELKSALSRYEKEIHEQTGLRMIYPYPKEIPRDAETLANIEASPLLALSCRQDIALVGYRLSPAVERIVGEKELLSQELSLLMEGKLHRLNEELGPFFRAFRSYYQKRKERTLAYAILGAKKAHSLSFPDLQPGSGCRLSNAVLPCLQKGSENYIPLSLALNRGSNLLVGANMTGKTTVLKTVYFHLTLVRMGLPVPAESAELCFPEQVELSLKSSGSLRSNLSGFGEEIQFFTKPLAPAAYVLADELFQSTDPVSGAELSRIMLHEFSPKELVFFCTSHYPEVQQVPEVNLFRMKEMDFDPEVQHSFAEMLGTMPYELEEITPEDIAAAVSGNRKPLRLALCFPLPESIKEKIRFRIHSDGLPGKDT